MEKKRKRKVVIAFSLSNGGGRLLLLAEATEKEKNRGKKSTRLINRLGRQGGRGESQRTITAFPSSGHGQEKEEVSQKKVCVATNLDNRERGAGKGDGDSCKNSGYLKKKKKKKKKKTFRIPR